MCLFAEWSLQVLVYETHVQSCYVFWLWWQRSSQFGTQATILVSQYIHFQNIHVCINLQQYYQIYFYLYIEVSFVLITCKMYSPRKIYRSRTFYYFMMKSVESLRPLVILPSAEFSKELFSVAFPFFKHGSFSSF